MNGSRAAQRSFISELVDGSEQSHSNDIVTRRMKNRERQRRYRARKRLEADSTQPHPETQPLEVMDPEPIAIAADADAIVVVRWNPRVHSRRDWKKEARTAHASKVAPASASESQSSGSISGTTMSELPPPPPLESDHDRVNNGAAATGRRDWKAEARTRKS